MISKERICGYLVEYDRDARDPERYAEKVWRGINIIPAVWAYFLIDGALKTRERINFTWKEKRAFNEKKDEIQEIFGLSAIPDMWKRYYEYEKNALEDWAEFCVEYEKLKQTVPELVREVIPFLERSVESENPEYYLWYESERRKEDYNLRGGLVPVGRCENPANIKSAIENDAEIKDKLQYENDFYRHWSDVLFLQMVPVETVDVACRVGEIRLPFLENFLARQGVAAPSLGLLTTPPAEIQTIPADSVPAFIHGEVVGIQGSVADVKRDTTLTENKKQTTIQEQILEEMKKQTEIQKQMVRNTGTVAENTVLLVESSKQTAQNTEKIVKIAYKFSDEQVKNIEKALGIDRRRLWQTEYQIPKMTPQEVWEWENPGKTLEGLDAEEKKAELNPIYKSISVAKAKIRKH